MERSQGRSSPPAATVQAVSSVFVDGLLEENKRLLCATLDSQNIGDEAKAQTYLSRLQHNLLFLATLADHQTSRKHDAGRTQPQQQQRPVPPLQQPGPPFQQPGLPVQHPPQHVQPSLELRENISSSLARNVHSHGGPVQAGIPFTGGSMGGAVSQGLGHGSHMASVSQDDIMNQSSNMGYQSMRDGSIKQKPSSLPQSAMASPTSASPDQIQQQIEALQAQLAMTQRTLQRNGVPQMSQDGFDTTQQQSLQQQPPQNGLGGFP